MGYSDLSGSNAKNVFLREYMKEEKNTVLNLRSLAKASVTQTDTVVLFINLLTTGINNLFPPFHYQAVFNLSPIHSCQLLLE